MKRIQTNTIWLRESSRKIQKSIPVSIKKTKINKKKEKQKNYYTISVHFLFLCANKKWMPKMWVCFYIFFFAFLWLALWVLHECKWMHMNKYLYDFLCKSLANAFWLLTQARPARVVVEVNAFGIYECNYMLEKSFTIHIVSVFKFNLLYLSTKKLKITTIVTI